MPDERDRAQSPGPEEAVAQRSHDLLSSVPRPGGAGNSESMLTVLVADAAYAVVTRASRECTGNTFLCEDVLAEEGVTDFDAYAYVPGAMPRADLFVDHV